MNNDKFIDLCKLVFSTNAANPILRDSEQQNLQNFENSVMPELCSASGGGPNCVAPACDSGSDFHGGIVVAGRDSGSDIHSGIARAEVVAEVTVIVE